MESTNNNNNNYNNDNVPTSNNNVPTNNSFSVNRVNSKMIYDTIDFNNRSSITMSTMILSDLKNHINAD